MKHCWFQTFSQNPTSTFMLKLASHSQKHKGWAAGFVAFISGCKASVCFLFHACMFTSKARKYHISHWINLPVTHCQMS